MISKSTDRPLVPPPPDVAAPVMEMAPKVPDTRTPFQVKDDGSVGAWKAASLPQSPRAVLGESSRTEAIAVRAYERFLARGCEHGHDLDDWIAAEQDFQATEP
jgi:Protein of unknown function (DUF2934)